MPGLIESLELNGQVPCSDELALEWAKSNRKILEDEEAIYQEVAAWMLTPHARAMAVSMSVVEQSSSSLEQKRNHVARLRTIKTKLEQMGRVRFERGRTGKRSFDETRAFIERQINDLTAQILAA